jgi:hypothetical protein
MLSGARIKRVLGELPLTAELDWVLRGHGAPVDGFNLEELKLALPEWCRQFGNSSVTPNSGKKILVFATLHYWINHATMLALALADLGNQVTMAYLPYPNWKKPVSKFDLRRREAYARSVFKPAEKFVDIRSFLGSAESPLPDSLEKSIQDVSIMDAQYTLQVEEVDIASDIYQLRLERNRAAAFVAQQWMQKEKPDVVILPNGLILEFGAVFHSAKYLEIPVVSYEFGEQRDRIWLSRNTPVMLQATTAFWEAKKADAFSDSQRQKVRDLFATRRSAGLFENFYRRWQNQPAQGGTSAKQALGLDGRPIVLLAANVIGDSLTLGRAAFTGDMSTWLKRTLHYFSDRSDSQLVIRVHPGERNMDGPSVADLLTSELPELPSHIHIVRAEDPINTYDLIEIADLGLVYTTTVGLEMAMSGLPVFVMGYTHYRNKGFTIDPSTWEEYYSRLTEVLNDPHSALLTEGQADEAWHYAYCFFFEYPQPFPWHLLHFWEDVETNPLSEVLGRHGQNKYFRAFEYLLGEPFDWDVNDR